MLLAVEKKVLLFHPTLSEKGNFRVSHGLLYVPNYPKVVRLSADLKLVQP